MVSVTTNLEWAKAYAQCGIAVFPCHTIRWVDECTCSLGGRCRFIAKHPRTEHGVNDATTDISQIEAWWTEWPRANIAGAMMGSGLLGGDIDPRNGGDESWIDVSRKLGIDRHPDTWTANTGGGGTHHIYRVDEAFNSTTDELAPGVDIKFNGYLILPPSVHRSGGRYSWEVGHSPVDMPEPLPLPEPLRARLMAGPEASSSDTRSSIADMLAQTCPEGSRHRTMQSIIGWARNIMEQAPAEALILSWNETHCRPPLAPDEVLTHIADLYRRYTGPAEAIFEDEAPPAPPKPWTVITGRELRVMTLPSIVWLLDDMIPVGRYVVLSGESGLGKSWWALLLALSCWLEAPFLGRTTTRTRTLYIDEENGVQEAQRRLQALADGLQIPPDTDLGVDFLIDESVKPGNAMHRAELARIIASGGYALVITDSLIRFFDGNENASNEVKAFHEAIDSIRRKTAVSWLMLQHLNKAGKDGSAISAGDRVRGSGEFKAHADVHIQLRSLDDGATVITHVEKLRGRVRPADITYRMEGNTMLDEPVVFTVLGSTAGAYGADNAALMYACELLEKAGPLMVTELVTFLKERYGVADRTAYRAIKIGRDSGSIVVDHTVGKRVFLRLRREDEA